MTVQLLTCLSLRERAQRIAICSLITMSEEFLLAGNPVDFGIIQ